MKFINRERFLPKIEVFFSPKSGEDQQIYALKGYESGHVLSVQNTEKEDIWAFFNVLGDKLFFIKKEYMSSKKRTYGNPTEKELLLLLLLCRSILLSRTASNANY